MMLRCAIRGLSTGAILRTRSRRSPRSLGICVAVVVVGSCGGTDRESPSRLRIEESQPAKNLLLIVVDTLRADHVGVYGGSVATPNLDRIARAGVRFTHAYSHIPITGPSHASIFSGVNPLVHGVHRNAQVMDDRVVTLAEVLRDRGSRTGAVVSLGVLQSRFGFNQGFEVYDDRFSGQWYRPAEEVTDASLSMLGEWSNDDPFFAFVHYSDPHEPYAPPDREYPSIGVRVDNQQVVGIRANGRGVRVPVKLAPGNHVISFENDDDTSRQRFTFQQFKLSPRGADIRLGHGWRGRGEEPNSANHTVDLPATLDLTVSGGRSEAQDFVLSFFVSQRLSVAEARQMYGLEVEYVDREIGRLLNELEHSGRLKKTIVVVTSDHGEGLGDHDLMGHIHQLYDTLIRVPLLMVVPGVSGGEVESSAIRLVDLRPTLLALLGAAEPSTIDGVDRSARLFGIATDASPPFLGMTFRPLARSELRCLIVDRFKVIRNEQSRTLELYDLNEDPNERQNLVEFGADSCSERLESITQLLDSLLVASRPGVSAQGEISLSAEERNMLESLGYVN